MSNLQQLTVFYDGQCPICSREVRLYKKLDDARRVRWKDLQNRAVLDAENFSYQSAMELLHVKDGNGILHVGIHAHLAMWAQLRYFKHLAALLKTMPAAVRLLEKFYVLFTRYRPGLVRQSDGKIQR